MPPSHHAKALRALLLSFLCMAALQGCLGDGSDSQQRPDNPPDGSVNGQVLDPPIEGALVKLVNAQGQARSALVQSDENGRFSLKYRGTTAGARLVATGGRDNGTGASFQGLALAAPLTDNADAIISPVTTLVAHLTNQGDSLQSARQTVGERLGLDTEILLDSPQQHGDLQHRAVMLAQFQTLLRGENSPQELLWQAVNQYHTDLATAAQTLADDNSTPLLTSTRERLRNNVELLAILADLDATESADQVLSQATQKLVLHTLERYLADSLDYVPSNPDAQHNLEELANAIWDANGNQGLQPDSPSSLNVTRYVLNHYDLDTDQIDQIDFQVPSGLSDDDNIALLADRDAIDPSQPLAGSERLGNDQDARRAYFFRSELSPFYRSEQLFDGVYDDNYLDPLYAAMAEGQARAGLLDDATATLRTRVFSPRERITAFRDAGQALLDQDQETPALDLLDQAREQFTAYVDGVGLGNIVSADAENAFRIVSSYLEAGASQGAEDTLAPLYDYVDAYGDPEGEFQGTYSKINSALVDLAEAQVQEAENQALEEPYYQQAVASTELLQRWTDGLGRQDNPLTCAAIRTQYTARYAALYARLGLNNKAQAATDTFTQLLQEPCNGFSTSYTYMIAPVYGYLEDFTGFEEFLTQVVTPIPPLGSINADEARKSIRAQRAVALAKNDSVPAAQDYLADELEDDLAEQLKLLTFKGGGITENDHYTITNVNRYMVNTLHDQNQDQLAQAVSAAAWDLVTSDAFKSRYQDAESAVEQGCRKMALVSEYLGDMPQARQRMTACADRALSLVDGAGTMERYRLLKYTGEGLYHFDLTDRLPNIASRLGDLVAGLDQDERITVERLRLRLLAAANDANGAQNLFAQIHHDISDQAQNNSDEPERKTAADAARELLKTAGYAADKLRSRTAKNGQPDPQELALAQELEEAAIHFAVNDDDAPLDAFAIIKQLNNVSRRNDSMADLAEYLGGFDALEQAQTVADAVQGQARYDRLAGAADGLAARDLFPDTGLASFDFDLDGRPDFFNPSEPLEPGTTPPLTLDDDIDGDGTPDTIDATPYCGSCQ